MQFFLDVTYLIVDSSSNNPLSRRVNSWEVSKQKCEFTRTRTIVQYKPDKRRSHTRADRMIELSYTIFYYAFIRSIIHVVDGNEKLVKLDVTQDPNPARKTKFARVAHGLRPNAASILYVSRESSNAGHRGVDQTRA